MQPRSTTLLFSDRLTRMIPCPSRTFFLSLSLLCSALPSGFSGLWPGGGDLPFFSRDVDLDERLVVSPRSEAQLGATGR